MDSVGPSKEMASHPSVSKGEKEKEKKKKNPQWSSLGECYYYYYYYYFSQRRRMGHGGVRHSS